MHSPRLYSYKMPRRLELVANGIDRKDSNVGYIFENCVTCCSTCNRAKGKLTEEEFVSMCQKVVLHRN